MIDNSIIQATSSWPFVEARKLVKERQKIYEKKGKITLQTGYGPSGLPHIGTFAEVARTTMMVNAIKQLIDVPTEIITFSDDMDGLRKIPDNIPNKEILEKNLHKPLTSVPDPFNKYKSFGEHNNEMLKKFLDKFKFNYTFKSSTETYKKGLFNTALLLVLEKYEDIKEIVLPTLGKERQKTYSPFLPICLETGKVLEVPIIEIKKKEGKIIYQNGDKKVETEVINGKCKLQWKVDWAMRWYAFDIDYEMYGKDLIESAVLSSKICKTLGKKSPNGFAYEMFLDEKGEKISKSKGNGITIEQWLKYASPESLSLYMYQNPKRAKKLYADVVPKAVDEYLICIDKFSEQDAKHRLLNPVWHVHNGNPPKEKSIMPFSVLLNLVGTSNATNKDVLWKFIIKYKKDIKVLDHPILDRLIEYALKYFTDIVKPNKKYRKPNEKEKKALQDLIKRLRDCKDQMDPEAIQTIVYSVGKDNGYKENLREWFKAIYEIIFGDQDGPRMGFFISFFGIKESIELINKYIK
ncbi:MAG: lysine--tRNA ligase [Pelagibacteraceae bacterium]|nr:lysine--tRNA ligase [Pelagibacteraceae bacterium]MDP6710493.1 lysine--tRNA ligase [Pelagibacteraceae bacterium]